MREVQVSEITRAVKDLFIDANCNLGVDVLAAFDRAIEKDESPVAKEVIRELKENARIARDEQSPSARTRALRPLCRDRAGCPRCRRRSEGGHQRGGQKRLRGRLSPEVGLPPLHAGQHERQHARRHPFRHCPRRPGPDRRRPKGGGAENMSRVDMLSPSAGLEGIKDFVVKRIEASGSNPCPPTVVGVGSAGPSSDRPSLPRRPS